MPIPFFRCVKCRKEFSTQAEAEGCEVEHLEVTAASAKQYTIKKHPYMIEVTFTDGSVKDYIADDMYY